MSACEPSEKPASGLLAALTINGLPVATFTQDVLQELWNVLGAKSGLWALRLDCSLWYARKVGQSICRGMPNVCISTVLGGCTALGEQGLFNRHAGERASGVCIYRGMQLCICIVRIVTGVEHRRSS